MPPIGSDVQDAPVSETAPVYCTVEDVYRFLQEAVPGNTGDEGEPSQDRVKASIIGMEDHIDTTLRRSWRARQRKLEYHPFSSLHVGIYFLRVNLLRSPVRTLTAASGDALEVWNGAQWEDWLALKTEGRAGDYWLEEPAGVLSVKRFPIYEYRPAVRVTYRYGETAVPKTVRDACAMLVAADMRGSDVIARGGNGGGAERMRPDSVTQRWERQAWNRLAPFQGVGGAR